MALQVFTDAEKPSGRRELDSQWKRAAMSGKVVRSTGASGWETWERPGAKKRRSARAREGSPFLTGRAASLATCWGEGGLVAFLVLPPEAEPEAACAYEGEGVWLGWRWQGVKEARS